MSMRRAALFGCVWLMTAGCSNGGSLSVSKNAPLSGVMAKLMGSCTSSGTPSVLIEGYCTEYFRPTPSPDSPAGDCSADGGTWATVGCVQTAGLQGRCLMLFNGPINVTYFSGTPDGPSRCVSTAAQAIWQDGSSF